ncbi:hypothetical protein FWD20_03945 [Candidatus Saccharibacteria bacterium]|nr:hypothetical protein [Candidatus Saccharibacteria bacterium]
MKKVGKVIKFGGLNVWPHESIMADILADAGHIVEFIPPKNKRGEYTPDVFIDGVPWEIKSPRSNKLSAVQRNLNRGKRQSSRIVFTSKRIKRIPDKAIQRELLTQLNINKEIVEIKFINRRGEIIDIKSIDTK